MQWVFFHSFIPVRSMKHPNTGFLQYRLSNTMQVIAVAIFNTLVVGYAIIREHGVYLSTARFLSMRTQLNSDRMVPNSQNDAMWGDVGPRRYGPNQWTCLRPHLGSLFCRFFMVWASQEHWSSAARLMFAYWFCSPVPTQQLLVGSTQSVLINGTVIDDLAVWTNVNTTITAVNEAFDKLENMHPVLGTIIGVSFLLNILQIFLSYKTYREYGWKIYQSQGASITRRKMMQRFHSFILFLKLVWKGLVRPEQMNSIWLRSSE